MCSVRISSTAMAGTAILISLATACAPPAPPKDVEAELAELRREHEEMQAELDSLQRLLAVREEPPGAPISEAAVAPNAVSRSGPLDLVLTVYRESLEDGDLERLRSAVYGGEVPRDDARLFGAIIERTRELELELDPLEVEVEGQRARLVVDHRLRFRLNRTHEPRRTRVALVMFFEEGPGGWHLVGISRD